MRSASLIALVMVFTPAAVAAEAPYPEVQLLEAFRDGCGSIKNQAATSTLLVAAGWRPVATSEESGVLAEFLAFSREEGEKAATLEGAEIGKIEAFEKIVAEEQVYIILDEVRADGVRITGCQLYDFGESRPLAKETAAKWLKRDPTATLDRPEIRTAEWMPGILPRHDSFKIFFVPNNSPAVQMVRFSGVALKSDTVGVE